MDMESAIDKQTMNHIIEAMNDDSLIIFVGAGVSANSGLPSWNQLISELRVELSLDDNEEDNLKVAQFYYDTWGQQKYFQKISNVFSEHTTAVPNEIHEQILKIQPRHVITTNYDTLLEEELNKGVTKYSIIKSDYDIPYAQGNRYLIKMHGDLDSKNIILKENDYLDYENNFSMISTLIKSLIMNNTILFIGYSLGDTTFNSIFRLIHNSLGDHTKKSYFYTPNQPKEAVIEYYKKKGIYVLSSGKDSIPNESLGEETVIFLSGISINNKNKKISNSLDLWDNIKFLDKLSFVESRDVVSHVKLEEEAYLYSSDAYSYNINNKEKKVFELAKESNAKKFLENKTWINHFLGNEITHPNHMDSNSILKPAFDLYKSNQNNEARVKFREISNEAYRKQDYMNYMISEFNVSNIRFDIFKEEPELTQSIVNAELREVIDKIVDSSNNDTKKSAVYFRDTILNFNFIYKKLFKINDLLDKLKTENNTVRNGGFSYNNNFGLLQYEFQSFIQFINKNCLCIGHYKEFQMIVNRYFESLVVAFDNSNRSDDNDEIYNHASSVIDEIEVSDVKEIIPYIDLKLLPIFLDKYSVNKIRITEEAFDYIMETSLELCSNIQSHTDNNCSLLSQYVKFLSYIDIQGFSHNKIISLFSNYPIFFNNKDEIKIILSMLLMKSDNFVENDIEAIFNCVSDHVKCIMSKNYEFHFKNFHMYSEMIKRLKKWNKDLCLSIGEVFEDFLIINNVPGKVKQIERYEGYISNFQDFLELPEIRLLSKILTKYSKLTSEEKSYNFIIELINSGSTKFNKIKKEVLSNIINRINTEEIKGMRSYPDAVGVATADLFNLIQQNYFDKGQIINEEMKEKMKGKSPVVDWMLFNIRTDEVIEGLLKIMSYSKLKEVLCSSKKDKKVLDEWAVRQFDLGRVYI